MKFLNLIIQILIPLQTLSKEARKCPYSRFDNKTKKELKMAFNLGSRTSTIVKEKLTNLEDIKNYKKDYLKANDGSWVFGNTRPVKVKIDSEELKKKFDVDFKEAMAYSSMFRTTFLSDCFIMHNLIDRAVFLFFELFLLDFQNLNFINKNNNKLLEDPFNSYQGFKKVTKENFKSKYHDFVIKEEFLEMIDNQLNFEKIKSMSKKNINKFLRALLHNEEIPNIFEIEDKKLKNDMMEQVGKYLTFYADVPRLILTFQMPLDYFVGFYKKLVEEGIFDSERELFINNFLNGFKNQPAKCKDENVFKKELCIALMSLSVDGIRIPHSVMSLTILVMDILFSLFFAPDDPNRYQPEIFGLREKLHIMINSSLKQIYFSLNKLDKEVFKQIWEINSFYEPDWVLLSYDGYDGKTVNNSDITTQGWIESIMNPKGRHALLYNALIKSVDDNRPKLISRDCDECLVLEIDAFQSINMMGAQDEKVKLLRFGNVARMVKKQTEWFYNLEKSRVIFEE